MFFFVLFKGFWYIYQGLCDDLWHLTSWQTMFSQGLGKSCQVCPDHPMVLIAEVIDFDGNGGAPNKRRLSSWSPRISSFRFPKKGFLILIDFKMTWRNAHYTVDHYGFTNNSDYGFYSHPKKSFASLLVEISTLKIAQIRGSHISSCTISQTWTSEMPAASCPMICWGPSCLVDNWWSGDLFTLPVSQHGTVANLIY